VRKSRRCDNVGQVNIQQAVAGAQTHQAFIDIEVGYQLVARVRPTGSESRYEIRLAQLLDGELHESGEPFEASFGPDFDEAVRALRR